MRALEEYEEALRWVRWGLNDCQISRLTGIPRHTVMDWRHGKHARGAQRKKRGTSGCPRCEVSSLDGPRYAYLLGLYLGDGCISQTPRSFRLRITLDIRYPNIIDECAGAIDAVKGGRGSVGFSHRPGCVEVWSYWNHWPCVFPQHGPGPKHLREIALLPWQREICSPYPKFLLRGLIHSDGSRDLNVVNGKSYPRYSFSNNSLDIHEVFCQTCKTLGVHWTRPYWKTVAISRRPDVAYLDTFIGPKT